VIDLVAHVAPLKLRHKGAEYTGGNGPRLIWWRNHYNVKDRRCYVELSSYLTLGPKQVFTLVELYDAIERNWMATHISGPPDEIAENNFCRVSKTDGSSEYTSCATAKQHIEARMSQ
jgi:hypothetical protein